MLDPWILFFIAAAALAILAWDYRIVRNERDTEWEKTADVVEELDHLQRQFSSYRERFGELQHERGKLQNQLESEKLNRQVEVLELQKRLVEAELESTIHRTGSEAWANMQIVFNYGLAGSLYVPFHESQSYFEFEALDIETEKPRGVKGVGPTREIALQDAIRQLSEFIEFPAPPEEPDETSWQRKQCEMCCGTGLIPVDCGECGGDGLELEKPCDEEYSGPGAEDGPWAEGWEERCGTTASEVEIGYRRINVPAFRKLANMMLDGRVVFANEYPGFHDEKTFASEILMACCEITEARKKNDDIEKLKAYLDKAQRVSFFRNRAMSRQEVAVDGFWGCGPTNLDALFDAMRRYS